MIPCLSSAFTCQAIITLIVYPTTFIDLAIPSITFFSDLFILEQHLHYTGSASYRPFMRGAIRQFGPPPPAGCLSFPALKVIDIRFFPCVGRRRWKPLLQRFHFPPPSSGGIFIRFCNTQTKVLVSSKIFLGFTLSLLSRPSAFVYNRIIIRQGLSTAPVFFIY